MHRKNLNTSLLFGKTILIVRGVRLKSFSSLLNRSCPLIGPFLRKLKKSSMSLALWVPPHSSRLVLKSFLHTLMLHFYDYE